jgi:hypothetical protein
MKNYKTIFIVMISATMILSSCRVVDFTIISTKNVSVDFKKTGEKRVKAWGWTIKDATDHAIEKAGTEYDALIDGVIYLRFFGYCAKGTPIKTKKQTL